MKIAEKQQLIILALTIMIIAGFGAMWYFPLIRKSFDIEKAKALHSAETAKAQGQAMNLHSLRKQQQDLREKTKNYDIKIPKNRDFAALWKQMADLMNRLNLKDQIIQPGAEISGDELNCIPINIMCTGRMSQLFELFNAMNKFDRMIIIEHVQLLNDKDFSGQIKLDVKANVYYRPNKTANI